MVNKLFLNNVKESFFIVPKDLLHFVYFVVHMFIKVNFVV